MGYFNGLGLEKKIIVLLLRLGMSHNMLLFWDVLGLEKLEIFCAEISLQRRKETGQIWGIVEWSETVMTLETPLLPRRVRHNRLQQNRCKILYSLSLNL